MPLSCCPTSTDHHMGAWQGCVISLCLPLHYTRNWTIDALHMPMTSVELWKRNVQLLSNYKWPSPVEVPQAVRSRRQMIFSEVRQICTVGQNRHLESSIGGMSQIACPPFQNTLDGTYQTWSCGDADHQHSLDLQDVSYASRYVHDQPRHGPSSSCSYSTLQHKIFHLNAFSLP